MAKQRKRTNKNVPAKGRMRDMCDTLWSRKVRAFWNWKCAVCGKGKIDAHHIVPRQFEATRYDPKNGIGLCSYCHQFDPKVSPHQNAAGFLKWLREKHPATAERYEANPRPEFTGTKNADYYCGVIRDLRQYFERDEFEKVVGIKFTAWLEENE